MQFLLSNWLKAQMPVCDKVFTREMEKKPNNKTVPT
jgi:hypothetical protein